MSLRRRIYTVSVRATWLLAALLIAAGCDSFRPVAFEEEYVVEAYLGAGEEPPSIRLGRTAPVDGTYDFAEVAVSHAEVSVALLSSSGQPEQEIPYTESSFRPGVYLPLSSDLIRPGRTYRLAIRVPATGERIEAETTVPAALVVTRSSADTLVYQGAEQLETDVSTPAGNVGDRNFIFTARALEPTEDNLTPFARSIYDQGDLTLMDLSTTSSPLLNEANYEEISGNTVRIKVPWLAISFYGANRLSLASVDRNYYDFYRTLGIQQGGSTLSPGEIPDIINHVEGGRGLFASYAQVSVDLYVAKEEELP